MTPLQYRPAMLADLAECVDVRGRTRDNAISAAWPATASDTSAAARLWSRRSFHFMRVAELARPCCHA